jgi:hypothetical protein
MIPDFKTYIGESIWSDIQKRSTGDVVRKEDGYIALKLMLDGDEYKFTNIFMSMGDEYNEENSDEWTCFAFNLPDNGTNIITGNTEENGVFGIDSASLGDNAYDKYVLKEYIEKSQDELADDIIKNGFLNMIGNEYKEIQDILVKYTKKIFEENLMSDLAIYNIYSLRNSDWYTELGAIWFYEGTDICESELEEEFPGRKIISEHVISFAELNHSWMKGLENELVNAYEKMGWVRADADPIDPYSGNPGNTYGIIFIKFDEQI